MLSLRRLGNTAVGFLHKPVVPGSPPCRADLRDFRRGVTPRRARRVQLRERQLVREGVLPLDLTP